MNVAFHVMTAVATTAMVASSDRVSGGTVSRCAGCFFLCFVLHGVLDLLPHGYPFSARTDMLIGALLFPLGLFLLKRTHWILFAAAYAGSTIPDLIDLGPMMLKRAFGISGLPEAKYFFWHWPEYSGSIFDGSRPLESFFYHALVVFACGVALWRGREAFRRSAIGA